MGGACESAARIVVYLYVIEWQSQNIYLYGLKLCGNITWTKMKSKHDIDEGKKKPMRKIKRKGNYRETGILND